MFTLLSFLFFFSGVGHSSTCSLVFSDAFFDVCQDGGTTLVSSAETSNEKDPRIAVDATGAFFITRTPLATPTQILMNFYHPNRSVASSEVVFPNATHGNVEMAGSGSGYGFAMSYFSSGKHLEGGTMVNENFNYFYKKIFGVPITRKEKVVASGAYYVFTYAFTNSIVRRFVSQELLAFPPLVAVSSLLAVLVDYGTVATVDNATVYAYLCRFGNGTTILSIESVGGPVALGPFRVSERDIVDGDRITLNALSGGNIPVVWSEGTLHSTLYLALFDDQLNAIGSEQSLYTCLHCTLFDLDISQIGTKNNFLVSFLESNTPNNTLPKALMVYDQGGISTPFFLSGEGTNFPAEGTFVSQKVLPQRDRILQLYAYDNDASSPSNPTYVAMRFFKFAELPSLSPTLAPTPAPTNSPTSITTHPTPAPTLPPTLAPSLAPTLTPTASPSSPTQMPTPFPSISPSLPTGSPTQAPTNNLIAGLAPEIWAIIGGSVGGALLLTIGLVAFCRGKNKSRSLSNEVNNIEQNQNIPLVRRQTNTQGLNLSTLV